MEDIPRRQLWNSSVPSPIFERVKETNVEEDMLSILKASPTCPRSTLKHVHEYLVPYEIQSKHTRIAALSLGTLRNVLATFWTRYRHEYGCLYDNRFTAANEEGAQTIREPEPVCLAVLAPVVWRNAVPSYYRPVQDMREVIVLYNDTYHGNSVKVRVSGSKVLTPLDARRICSRNDW